MAFQKKTWLARLGQGLNKFILNGGSRVTLDSSPDTVTQQGTPLSAENMNDLEDRIDSEFTNVNSAISDINMMVTFTYNPSFEAGSIGTRAMQTSFDISSYINQGYKVVSLFHSYVTGSVDCLPIVFLTSNRIYANVYRATTTAFVTENTNEITIVFSKNFVQ